MTSLWNPRLPVNPVSDILLHKEIITVYFESHMKQIQSLMLNGSFCSPCCMIYTKSCEIVRYIKATLLAIAEMQSAVSTLRS
jgi:hypothetical protein